MILRFALGAPPGTVFADQQQGVFFSDLGDMAFAADGDLYVADILGNRVLRITPQGNGTVFEQFGLDPHGPRAVTAVKGGHVYVGMETGEIFRYDPGDPGSKELLVTLAAGSAPFAMAMSLDDSRIYVTTFSIELLAVDPFNGVVTTVLPLIKDGLSFTTAIAVAPAPAVPAIPAASQWGLVVMTRSTLIAACVLLVLGAGARGQFTPGHVFMPVGNDPPFPGGDRIWEIDPATGDLTLFAQVPGVAGGSRIKLVFTPGVTRLRASLELFDQIIEFDSEGNQSVVLDGADGIILPLDLTYDADGNLFVLVASPGFLGGQILRFANGNPPGTVFADQQDGLLNSGVMAFAADGDLYVADNLGNRVLRITPQGSVSVFEQFGLDPSRPEAVTADKGGRVYVGMGTGEIFQYAAGDPGSKELLVTLPGTFAQAMTMFPDDSQIYVVAVFGQLWAVNPLDGVITTVVVPNTEGIFLGGLAVAPFPDDDGDGVFNIEDNCPSHANPDQADCDNDGTGDVCTIADCTGDPACADCDVNQLPDACDPDGDADGTINACDGCPTDPDKLSPGPCGCGTPDTDTDLDTILDCNDRCPGEDDLLDENANGQPDCLEDIPLPTLSTWGMVIMAVLLLAVGRRVFGSDESRALPPT